MATPRLSFQALKVARMFYESPSAEFSGSQLGKDCQVGSGTLYPLLGRLEAAGWLKSKWESKGAAELGRPRMRLYRATPSGLRSIEAALEQVSL